MGLVLLEDTNAHPPVSSEAFRRAPALCCGGDWNLNEGRLGTGSCRDGGHREVRRGRWAVMDGDSGNDGEEKPLTV